MQTNFAFCIIYRDLKITGHKLVPLIWELSRVCDKDSKKYVHWGGTTQNIVSNGDILILRRIHNIALIISSTWSIKGCIVRSKSVFHV